MEQALRMLWQKTQEGGARLVQAFGSSPNAVLPSMIEGRPLTEIAPYCFAGTGRLGVADGLLETVTGDVGGAPPMRRLCREDVLEISLPDSVERIGEYAFYNCKSLTRLWLGKKARQIGSDAFMNTLSLERITLRCHPGEESGLRQMVSQVSKGLEACFWAQEEILALLFYPEYDEAYDEVAPAHLFGRRISGEGFRARQRFADGRLDFAGYDAVFSRACVEESEETLSKMALFRLQYPYALSDGGREAYRGYLKRHMRRLAASLAAKRELSILQFLCRDGLLCGADLAFCVQEAARAGFAEGAASLLREQGRLGQRSRQGRYDFDA